MDRAVDLAIARLDGWLDGMRAPQGYGGPVVHWWRDSLLYCGPGLDWRYEGIIAGYVTLFERTADERWLAKATTAGDDLLRGQDPDGTFHHSRFELNPGPGGRPHEAAVDIGLLLLARRLRSRGDPRWESYLGAARHNLADVYLAHLWSATDGRIRDGAESFVPNKAATAVEALCLLAEITGRDDDLSRVVAPTVEAIIEHQVVAPGDPLDGGIAQSTIGRRVTPAYFPYYVARCIPGLESAYRSLGERRYLDSALRAAAFLVRWRDADGGWPQVVYGNRRLNRYPRWIAGAGDLLRALCVVAPYGVEADPGPTLEWILAGQLGSGGVRTAEGFGSRTSQRHPRGAPDFRDVLAVAGWNDKAFRTLAMFATGVDTAPSPSDVELECTWRGRRARYRETPDRVEVVTGQTVRYRWRKGDSWAVMGRPGANGAIGTSSRPW